MEMPPLRPLVFVLTFLGVFAILAVTIPYGFLVTAQEYRQQEIEEYYEGLNIQAFNQTWTYEMDEMGGNLVFGYLYVVDVDLGGHDFDFEYTKAGYYNLYVQMRHFYAVWLIFTDFDYFRWINSDGIDRTTQVGQAKRLILADLEADYEDAQPYTVQCDHFQFEMYFAYDDDIYTSVEDAWDNKALHVLIGINFDQMGTGMNAWDLINMVMFFQMPNVHWTLNTIIALPLWVCFTWLIASFVIAFIRSLPFT